MLGFFLKYSVGINTIERFFQGYWNAEISFKKIVNLFHWFRNRGETLMIWYSMIRSFFHNFVLGAGPIVLIIDTVNEGRKKEKLKIICLCLKCLDCF